jgi:hypothetical protein
MEDIKRALGKTKEDRALFLKPTEVASVLSIDVVTLQTWRKDKAKVQPRYIKIDKTIRYPLRDLAEFLANKTVNTIHV